MTSFMFGAPVAPPPDYIANNMAMVESGEIDDLQQLEAALQEINVQESQQLEQLEVDVEFTLLKDVLKSVKEEIVADASTSVKVREYVSLSDEIICQEMVWLDEALRSSRKLDVVWTSFHKLLTTRRHHNQQGFAFTALKLMQELVRISFRKPPQCDSAAVEELSDRDKDIVKYIAGYLLRHLPLHPETGVLIESYLPTEADGMTKSYDRGGLIVAKAKFVELLYEIEISFRSLPPTSSDRKTYFALLQSVNIPSRLDELLGDLNTSEESKNKFYIALVSLYFTARVNQKCRQIVEANIRATNTFRKSKALRDSL